MSGRPTFEEIASELGVTRQAVCNVCRSATAKFIRVFAKLDPEAYSVLKNAGMADDEIVEVLIQNSESVTKGHTTATERVLAALAAVDKQSYMSIRKRWFLPDKFLEKRLPQALVYLLSKGRVTITKDRSGQAVYSIKKNK